jgi:hypothetical protein
MNFRDLPIRRKLALLIMTSSVLAVILACMGFAVYERQNFRANTGNELTGAGRYAGGQYRRVSGL